MPWAFFIVAGWLIFWGVWGEAFYGRAGQAKTAFQACIITAWLAMLAILGLLSR